VESRSSTTSDHLFVQPVLADYTLGHIYFPYRDEDDLCCLICRGAYQQSDLIIRLACQHMIHLPCAMSWFLESGRLRCLQCMKSIRRRHVKSISYRNAAPLLSTLKLNYHPPIQRRWLYDSFGKPRSTNESIREFSSDHKLQDFFYGTKNTIVRRYARVFLRILEFQDDILALKGKSLVFDKDGVLILALQKNALALEADLSSLTRQTIQPIPLPVASQTSLEGQQTPLSLRLQGGLELPPSSQSAPVQQDSEQEAGETGSMPTPVDASPSTPSDERYKDLHLSDDTEWPRLPPPGTQKSDKGGAGTALANHLTGSRRRESSVVAVVSNSRSKANSSWRMWKRGHDDAQEQEAFPEDTI
jgi:hypothetical protein